jgi:hypothetical protein
MSPIPFGTPPYPITLPTIDIDLLGSIILTVWQIANTNSLLIVMVILFLAIGLMNMLIKFVTRSKAADVELGTFQVKARPGDEED